MADSYHKKEREKKRRKRKQEKAEKKEQRKLEGSKTQEFMYVDADGNLTSTPPESIERPKVELEDIEVSIPRRERTGGSKFEKTGAVSFFDHDKGYGFILEDSTQRRYFVHTENIEAPIKERDRVRFEPGKGPRGPIALSVKLI